MEIEKIDSIDAFEIRYKYRKVVLYRKVLDAPPSTDISFHQRMKEFTSAVISDIHNQIASEATVSLNVSETCN